MDLWHTDYIEENGASRIVYTLIFIHKRRFGNDDEGQMNEQDNLQMVNNGFHYMQGCVSIWSGWKRVK